MQNGCNALWCALAARHAPPCVAFTLFCAFSRARRMIPKTGNDIRIRPWPNKKYKKDRPLPGVSIRRAASPLGRGPSVPDRLAPRSHFAIFDWFKNQKSKNRKICKIVSHDRANQFSSKSCPEEFLNSTCQRVARVGAAVHLMLLSPVKACHQHWYTCTVLSRELADQTAHARSPYTCVKRSQSALHQQSRKGTRSGG